MASFVERPAAGIPVSAFIPLTHEKHVTMSQAVQPAMEKVIEAVMEPASQPSVEPLKPLFEKAKQPKTRPLVTTVNELTPDDSPVDSPIEETVVELPTEIGEPARFELPVYPDFVPASTRLQQMIKEDRLIVCPGVYDGLSARVAHEVGFDALYMTGAGTSCSRLGMADLGLATLSDMRAQAEMICGLDPRGPPVIADMDGGYGGPMMVARATAEYIRAGVAGFHIEDQLIQKRCGHLKGKKVVSREEYYSRIRAAQATRKQLGSDIVLIARTDALQSLGYDECIARLKGARALGADVGLLEGFANKEQALACSKEFEGWPLLMNSVENGVSPLITVEEAKEMGFRLMIFSFASIAPAYVAIKNVFNHLKEHGILGTDKAITPKKLFEVCGLEGLVEIDGLSGGEAFKGGV